MTAAGLLWIEQGKRHPNLRTLEALARALDLRVTVTRDGTEVRPRRRTK